MREIKEHIQSLLHGNAFQDQVSNFAGRHRLRSYYFGKQLRFEFLPLSEIESRPAVLFGRMPAEGAQSNSGIQKEAGRVYEQVQIR